MSSQGQSAEGSEREERKVSLAFPAAEETMDCPHCQGRNCAFARARTVIAYSQESRFYDDAVKHLVEVAYCRGCAGPIIKDYWERSKSGESWGGVVYPIASTRSQAPKGIKEADKDLAMDYNEAVACEPHSSQATVVLLARCASQMLVAKCGAKKQDGLRRQFATGVKSGQFTGRLAEEVGAISESRNQVGHVWWGPDGALLRVPDDDANWWFEIITCMFEDLYLAPERSRERIARLDATRQQKKAGDKT